MSEERDRSGIKRGDGPNDIHDLHLLGVTREKVEDDPKCADPGED